MIAPYWDRERRTCIVVHRTESLVKYIPLEVAIGLEVLQMKATEFDQKFTQMVNYSAEKACRLYASYAQTIGATKEALDFLGKLIEITDKEYKMATTKKNAAAVKSVPAKKVSAVSKEAKPKTTENKKSVQAAKPAKSGVKKPSAAQMFQDLIMKGKLTDDQIFEKVQAEFGLDDKKRAYVNWYRNNLRKQGKTPPDAK